MRCPVVYTSRSKPLWAGGPRPASPGWRRGSMPASVRIIPAGVRPVASLPRPRGCHWRGAGRCCSRNGWTIPPCVATASPTPRRRWLAAVGIARDTLHRARPRRAVAVRSPGRWARRAHPRRAKPADRHGGRRGAGENLRQQPEDDVLPLPVPQLPRRRSLHGRRLPLREDGRRLAGRCRGDPRARRVRAAAPRAVGPASLPDVGRGLRWSDRQWQARRTRSSGGWFLRHQGPSPFRGRWP